jgi:formylglycine-generating enzyme required for sulfatase activity
MEWTQDCYHKNYQGAPGDGSAWLENSCKQRVARGGAFNTPTSGVRTAKRVSLDATARENNLGIRLVREY